MRRSRLIFSDVLNMFWGVEVWLLAVVVIKKIKKSVGLITGLVIMSSGCVM